MNLRNRYMQSITYQEERAARKAREASKAIWDEYYRRLIVRDERRAYVDFLVADHTPIFNPWTDL